MLVLFVAFVEANKVTARIANAVVPHELISEYSNEYSN